MVKVWIPNSVTEIGEKAFYNCGSVKDVMIGTCVARIDRGAFVGCTNLTTFAVSPDNEMFFEKSGLLLTYDVYDGEVIGAVIVAVPRYLEDVAIPEGVKRIGYDDEFAECYNLKHVTISASVTEIALGTFADCPLESLTIDLGNPRYFVENNCLCDRETGESYLIYDN